MQPPADCLFYQTIELPNVGVVPGSWDHRDAADVFLGHVDFHDKHALDVGPANGFFSFEMEKRGAEVTAIDLGQQSAWDVVPQQYSDEETLVANMRRNVRLVENAFWFSHKALNSKVKLVYGSVYDVPKLIPSVDIALMSNVLQHFRDPLLAIQRVSTVVKETLVITETLWHDDPAFINSASIRLIPRVETPEVNHSWWQASPSFVMELLKLLGFPVIRSEIHLQKFNGASADSAPRMVKHFTLAATRPQPLPATQFAGLQIDYSSGFHALECNAWHSWRWSSNSRAEVCISNLSSENLSAGLVFGLTSMTPNAVITIRANGIPVWKATSFYGTRPVSIPGVGLAPGRNILEFSSTDDPIGPAPHDQRILGFAIYDFSICQPFS